MPQIRCPNCRTLLDVAPEHQGQAIVCPHCRAAIQVQSATTRIQVPDMRLEPPAPVALSPDAVKDPATDLPAVKVARTSWDRFLASSAAFRREMARFADDALPELRGLRLDPIPDDVPDEADDLGEPLASFHIPGERKLLSKSAGVFLWLIGASVFVIGVILLANGAELAPRNSKDPAPLLMFFIALPLAALGFWLGCFRKTFVGRTLWICPDGLIWQHGTRAGFTRWPEVADFAASGVSGRPLIWISPRRGIDFAFSTGQSAAIAPIAEYVELKASAALLPIFLERICRGERVKFGQLTMDRAGIRCGRGWCDWREVTGMYADGTVVAVELIDRRRRFHLPSRDVSFPMVAQAIARIVTEEGLPADVRRSAT